MVYAQIKSGLVVNVVVLDDASLIPLFSAGFDHFIQIDNLVGGPGKGWSYDGENFIAPPPEPEPFPEE